MSTDAERWASGPSVLQSVWRYWWLVLAVTLLAGVLGYGLSQLQDEVYEASTILYLTDPGTSAVFDQGTSPSLDRYIPQQAEQATSGRVLTAASEELEGEYSPAHLDAVVEVSANVELSTMRITASDSTAEGAAVIANAIAAAYQETVLETQISRVNRATEELDRAAANIEAQIEELSAAEADQAGAQAQIGVLTQRLVEVDTLSQQLMVDARLFGSGVEFVEQADAPTSPAAPRPLRTAAMLAVLGAALAAAFAYWLAGRARRITTSEQPAEILGVRLLGSLPTYKPPTQGTLLQRTTLDPRLAEAYRFVYSSIDLVTRELGAKSVLITSAEPGVGKTETALQVAATASRRGRETLLVDGDVRMRGLTSFLRAGEATGLLDLADSPELQNPMRVLSYQLSDQQRLDILTAGRLGSDEPGSINERWFGEAYRELTQSHDLVVMDSPPLLAVADTATIAAYSDAIVLVVREGSAIGELERVRQRLSFVGPRLIGYVYLSSTALDDTHFDYGLVRTQAQSLTPSRARGQKSKDHSAKPQPASNIEDADSPTSTAPPSRSKPREAADRLDTGVRKRGHDN